WPGYLPVLNEMFHRIRVRRFFFELGWFPQRENLQVDSEGVNASSSIARMDVGAILTSQTDRARLSAFINRYINANVPPVHEDRDYVFCPLQLESDTNILRFSPNFKS